MYPDYLDQLYFHWCGSVGNCFPFKKFYISEAVQEVEAQVRFLKTM